jgi:hypothetical protein
MVSPVRVRVPPLPIFSGFFLFKLQTHGFLYVAFGFYSGLSRSFPGGVAVRVPVKTRSGDSGPLSNVAPALTFLSTSVQLAAPCTQVPSGYPSSSEDPRATNPLVTEGKVGDSRFDQPLEVGVTDAHGVGVGAGSKEYRLVLGQGLLHVDR